MDSDLACLQQYANSRDAAAFAELVRLYAGMVYAVARRITGDVQEAEDVTQNCFLSLARNAGTIRTNIVGWLHRAATHRALDAVRNRRRAHRLAMAGAKSEAVDPAPSEWDQISPFIDEAIANLPDDLRSPLVLHYFQSRTQVEVARELNLNQSTVSRRLEKAIEQLRESLQKNGLTASSALPGLLASAAPPTVAPALNQSLLKIGLSGIGPEKSLVLTLKPLAIAAVVLVIGGTLAVLLLQSHAGNPPAMPVQPVAAIAPLIPPAPATLPTTAPTTRPSAVELLRDARKAEEWIDHVQSFSFELDGKWITSPEQSAIRIAKLQKQFPDKTIDEKSFPEIRVSDLKDKAVVAFDQQRLLTDRWVEGSSHFQRVWDGQKRYGREQWFGDGKQHSIAINPTVGRSFDYSMFLFAYWPRATHRRFWWDPEAPGDTAEEMRSVLERRKLLALLENDALVAGPVVYRGVWCWVVMANNQGFERSYIGMADHRLYGATRGVVNAGDKWMEPYIKVAAARGGTITTIEEFFKWTDTYCGRSQEKYERVMGAVNMTIGINSVVPSWEMWTCDYREVAPGCWLPYEQGWISKASKDGKIFEDQHHEQTVTKVTVNEKLADGLFKFEMTEGADVYDGTFTPALSYKWKKDRTADEWQTVFADADKRQREMDAMQAALNKVVHQPAPEFPKSVWLNSEPLTWESLRGKVVILDFWAEWCAPCRNDLPMLASLHQRAKETGIVIVGVHTPGSSMAKIRSHMKEFGIDYPVCIDIAPTERVESFGKMSGDFGVRGIPQTFVIAPDGVVAGQGLLSATLEIAQNLVAHPRTTTKPTTKPE